VPDHSWIFGDGGAEDSMKLRGYIISEIKTRAAHNMKVVWQRLAQGRQEPQLPSQSPTAA
jgi:hypothetical protein